MSLHWSVMLGDAKPSKLTDMKLPWVHIHTFRKQRGWACAPIDTHTETEQPASPVSDFWTPDPMVSPVSCLVLLVHPVANSRLSSLSSIQARIRAFPMPGSQVFYPDHWIFQSDVSYCSHTDISTHTACSHSMSPVADPLTHDPSEPHDIARIQKVPLPSHFLHSAHLTPPPNTEHRTGSPSSRRLLRKGVQ